MPGRKRGTTRAVKGATSKKKRGGQAEQADQLEVERRLAQIEALMVSRIRTSAITRRMSQEWGVNERTVYGYMRTVKERWEAEAKEDRSRERKRNAMRKSLDDGYSRAITATEPLRDAAGNVMTDVHGKPMIVETPQLQPAARFAKLLMDLDGLCEPAPVQRVAIETPVAVAVSVDTSQDQTREALEAWMKRETKRRETPAEAGKKEA